jgi:hypothetical protein
MPWLCLCFCWLLSQTASGGNSPRRVDRQRDRLGEEHRGQQQGTPIDIVPHRLVYSNPVVPKRPRIVGACSRDMSASESTPEPPGLCGS